MKNFSDELLCETFSYFSGLELIRSRLVCKNWNSNLESTTRLWLWNNVFNELIGRKYYHSIDESNLRSNLLNWKEKFYKSLQLTRSDEPFNIFNVISGQNGLTCRSGHSANILYDEWLVLFGGSSHLFTFLNSFDVYSVKNNEIFLVKQQIKGQVPSPRWLHSAVTFQNHIIIYGGQSNIGFEDGLYILVLRIRSDLNPPTLVFYSALIPQNMTAPRPGPRVGHSMLPLDTDNNYIMFGGMTINQIVMNDVFLLNIRYTTSDIIPTPTWTLKSCTGSTPRPRWCHSAQLVFHNMIVFGGWVYKQANHNHIFLNDVCVLDTRTYAWTIIQTGGVPPHPRCQAACFYFSSTTDISTTTTTTTTTTSLPPISTTNSLVTVETTITTDNNNNNSESNNIITESDSDISSIQSSSSSQQYLTPNVNNNNLITSIRPPPRVLQPSNGYFIIYGGSCHFPIELHPNAEDHRPYGSIVMDLEDFQILDLDTFAWLPIHSKYYRSRGGVNGVTAFRNGYFLSGGMHSEVTSTIPRFKNDLVFVSLNLE